MRELSAANSLIPPNPTIDKLQDASERCTACDLYKNATQTVFGDGARRAEVMFVGEQPGDREDKEGKPFVGPAGLLLDKALEEAGIDRKKIYITNVVKHFKWNPKGKRRIHQKPNAAEMAACRPWLDSEIAVLKPKVIVCLGATAAQALLGRTHRVTVDRGKFTEVDGVRFTSTVHPSSILRIEEDADRDLEMKRFIKDLGRVAAEIRKAAA